MTREQQPPTSCGPNAGTGEGIGPPGIPRGAGRSPSAEWNIPIVVLVFLLVFLLALFAFGPALHAQETSVGLGTADDFAVLAGTTITNTGPTTITGDVGLDPGTGVSGFDSVTLNGDLHVDDAAAEQAKVDLEAAYDDVAGRTATETVATELGGQTLTAGVYNSAAGTFGITGTLTLDAQDDPDAIFIFQMASTLGTAAASSVNLINGADACNVFWQVGSSATLGATSSLAGNILALTSITAGAGATVEGRTLAQNGAVTLDSNTITQEACIAAVEPTTTTLAPEPSTTTTIPATTTTLAPESTTTLTPTATTTTTIPESTTTLTAAATTTTLAPAATTTTLAPGATTTPGDTAAGTDSGDATASTVSGVVNTSGDTTTTNLAAPVGGVDTGGSSPGAQNMIVLLGASLLVVAVGAFVVRRRLQDQQPD